MTNSESEHWIVDLVRLIFLIAIIGYSAHILKDNKILGPYIQYSIDLLWTVGIFVGIGIVILIGYFIYSGGRKLPNTEDKRSTGKISFLSNENKESDQFDKIVQTILMFSPRKPSQKTYKNNMERAYQDQLYQWLKHSFPETKFEEQRGSSRPDIIINNIAIELKGPTTREGLDTIASKLLRYQKYFDKRIIFVFFDHQCSDKYFDDWETGVKQKYPEIIIIIERNGKLHRI